MRRIVPSVPGAVAVGLLLGVVAACGASSAHTALKSGVKPKKGHVYTHPTAAQSYMYLPFTAVRESNGDILVTDAGNWDRSGGKIVQLTSKGKPDWVYTGGLDFPHSAYPVGKKDILISDTNNNRVFMINRKGKTLWTTDKLGGGNGNLGSGRFSDGGQLLYPNDAVMMAHKRILISSRFNSTVWEINMKGKVVWKCAKFMFRQHRPRLLSNGDLMVADSDNARVITINHACNKVVYSYGGTDAFGRYKLEWPRSFNNYGKNYLISDSEHNRVLEINSKKQIVQQWKNLPAPAYLEVEKNKDILMGDSNIHGVIELAPNGTIAHQYPTHEPHPYHSSLINGGFESGKNQGWTRGDLLTETLPPGKRADMTFDTHVHHSGKSSGRIRWTANKPHLFLFWQQLVAVKPGKTYHFSGWIKTTGVQSCNGCDFGAGTNSYPSANYFIGYVKQSPNTVTGGPGVLGFNSGTQGWTKDTAAFTVPSGVKAVVIQCILYGRGTVWFDDVSLH